jgi:PAS domain S-box-containing protein
MAVQLKDQLNILEKANYRFNNNLAPEMMMRSLVTYGMELVAATAGAFNLYSKGMPALNEYCIAGEWTSVQLPWISKSGRSTGFATEQPKPSICNTCGKDSQIIPENQQALNIHARVAIPIVRSPEGEMLGWLELYNKANGLNFDDQDIAILKVLTASVATALEQYRVRQAYQNRQNTLDINIDRFIRSQQFANIGTWDWNIQTGDLYWSDRIGPLFGYPLGELETTYENFLLAVHPDDRTMVIDAINACINQDKGYQIEHRVVWPDGSVHWVLECGDVQRDQAGKPLHMLGVVKDITRRKAAEAALQAERDFAEVLINTAQAIVLVLDNDGNIVHFNPYMEEVSGYSLEEVKGQDWFDIFLSTEDSQRLRELFKCAIGDIQTRGNVNAIVTKHGELRTIDWYDKTFKDVEGNVVGLLAMGQDITQRLEIDAALRESEERFRNLVESASDWIWEIDQEGVYKYVSPHVQDILGYEPESLIGKSPFHLMPTEEAERLRACFEEIIRHRSPINKLENINLHRSGRRVILETSGAPFFDSDGVLKGYRGIDRDITERKTAELALMEQTLRNKFILDNTHDGFVIVTLDGRLREVNDAYCKLVKYDRDTLLRMRIADLTVSGDPKEVERSIKKVMELGHYRFESSHRCSDGSIVDLDVSTNLAAVGEDWFIFAFVRDVTEHRINEQKRLLEVRAQRDTLVREVHHRIKNHLQGIISLLRNHITERPEIAEAMESAIGQVDSIAMIHGLQSRMQEGRIELAMLVGVICKAVGSLSSKTIQLDTSRLRMGVIIRPMDGVPVALIINELLQNALKHTPALSQKDITKVELYAEDSHVVLHLSNPSPVPLPDGFDLIKGTGLGTGLTLARDLLPHQGAGLSISWDGDQVITRLTLNSPVIALEEKE